MANCGRCGAPLKQGASFCAACGTRALGAAGPLPPPPPAPPGAPGPQLPIPAPLAPLAAARLLVAQGQSVPLCDGLTVGRDPSCTLVLDDAEVSRRHATFVAHGAGWAVQDMGSRNGTFVNGDPVTAATPIYHGDRIAFGAHVVLTLHDPPSVRPAALALASTVGLAVASAGPGQAQARPLRTWKQAPQVEGRILNLRGPTQIERGGKVGKALFSVVLGAVNPALVFLPWMVGSSHILITTLRVEEVSSGRKVAVTLLGDLRSELADGDLIAVWGKDDHGTLLARALYNYELDTMLTFK